ncbi:MAG TPA: translation initiation factor IF-3 [Candidatus Acidoferrales bacterium]|nr:translation initiation factor IF-3 [Candidatus Acidoferrales bacterium]
MSRPFAPQRNSSPASQMRVNGKIRAREVRVIGSDNKQLGIFQLNDALNLARQHGVDLVEISPNAVPPVCRLVEIGKFRYELAKKEKESRKHQHASTVKEVQLSPRIDPHDLQIKVQHAVNFLCEDMKVKVALKFRGREMAHTEIGFEVVNKFLGEIAQFGHPDFQPKLVGRAINIMITPLPRNKRAKNPHRDEAGQGGTDSQGGQSVPKPKPPSGPPSNQAVKIEKSENSPSSGGGFNNNPFAGLEIKP